MRILVFILSIFVFVKTVSYGIYEYKNNNKISAVIIYIITIISSVLPNIVLYYR